MIEITLEDIIQSIDIFSKIMGQPVKGSLAFRIARLARELNKEMETFNQERMKILNECGEKDENGNLIQTLEGNIKIKPELIAKCNADFQSLVETKVEINCERLHLDDLDAFTITPQEMSNIQAFIEE